MCVCGGGGGNSKIISIIHGMIKNRNRKEDLLVTRNEIVSSYFYFRQVKRRKCVKYLKRR